MASRRRKPSSVVRSTRFERKMAVVLEIDVNGIRYYEILAENESINAFSFRDSWTVGMQCKILSSSIT